MFNKRSFLTLAMLLFFSGNLQAAVTTYDYTFSTNDAFSADFSSRLNSNFTRSLTGGINSISTANVVNDTLTEADMADEINPRIRTYEGASCEKVDDGLLPAADSDLTTDTSAGTGYPRGYRIDKASATAHTYTASRWTFVDIDINGDFQYTEVAIDASTPAVAANSIRLARVSTDTTQVLAVQDLRTTSCTSGPFSAIGSATGEADLDDVLKNGAPVLGSWSSTSQGFQQGAQVSWDTYTTFKIKAGTVYINGKYRSNASDTTVPVTADDPTNGTSGIVAGGIAASTAYNIYAVADQSASVTFSVSFGTAATGLTNSRKIGSIKTDANSLFTSADIYGVNSLLPKEIVGAYTRIHGGATPVLSNNRYNISSLTDSGVGNLTLAWTNAFATDDVAVVCSAIRQMVNPAKVNACQANAHLGSSVNLRIAIPSTDASDDSDSISVLAFGEKA